MAYLAEEYVAESRTARIETQLSSTIDLLVGPLRAGSALRAALEASLREARPPLLPYLQEAVGRIRLGRPQRRARGAARPGAARNLPLLDVAGGHALSPTLFVRAARRRVRDVEQDMLLALELFAHLGLIEEASGHFAQAERLHGEAVEKNPSFEPAGGRLKGLRSR